jgi:hypothetical protein
MSSEMTMMIFTASTSLQKILLTTKRALSARGTLAGLFLSMFCAAQLKLDLSAMTNSLSQRILTHALLNSQQSTKLGAARRKDSLASSSHLASFST